MKIDENEYLSWLEEQAEKWEDRAENCSDWAVEHKLISLGHALAMRSCISELKSLQQKKGEGR